MTKPTLPYIPWTSRDSLSRHHGKRITIDDGCFEELIGIKGRDMTEAEYHQRSLEAKAYSWAEYEGQHREDSEYLEPRHYFVDDDLVCTITDIAVSKIYTCFHAAHPKRKHFDLKKPYVNDRSEAAIGNRRLDFIKKIKNRIRGDQLLNFKAVKGLKNV